MLGVVAVTGRMFGMCLDVPGLDGASSCGFLTWVGVSEWQGRGGDGAKRQANNLARPGVFDLLASVAGQILQDAGSGDPNKAKQSGEEACKERAQSDLDSQITSAESVKDLASVDKPQAGGERAASAGGMTDACTVGDVCGQGSSDVEMASCAVRTPSQEEERKAFVKDVSADEGNGAAVDMDASAVEDLVSAVTSRGIPVSRFAFVCGVSIWRRYRVSSRIMKRLLESVEQCGRDADGMCTWTPWYPDAAVGAGSGVAAYGVQRKSIGREVWVGGGPVACVF